jgi:hypothetical protein
MKLLLMVEEGTLSKVRQALDRLSNASRQSIPPGSAGNPGLDAAVLQLTATVLSLFRVVASKPSSRTNPKYAPLLVDSPRKIAIRTLMAPEQVE